MPKLNIAELNRLYTESEDVDKDLFAEQRSNLLLIAGEHYNKTKSKFWARLRDTKEISSEQKLRLTKNHLHKIVKTYVNNILSHAPSVGAVAKNENELSDQKAAELHQAVILDAKQKQKFKKKLRDFAEDYCGIGEVAAKIFWDPNAGVLTHFEQALDEKGEPVFNEDGSPKEGNPVFSGDLVIERLFGFNLLRPADIKSMDEAPYLIVRKMADKKNLLANFKEGDARIKFIEDSSEESFMVFDGATGVYSKTDKTQVMLREYYFKPSPDYPMGYFFITTSSGVLWEGELPFGIFPIVFKAFDEIQTTARGRSIVKLLRPYQAEVNRSASKIAEHQITLGDDKLLIQSGTKITNGGVLPGVRGITYTGMAPGVLPGRTGEQYHEYMLSQIKEMYEVANVFEDTEAVNGQMDPYAMLFRSIRNKKKFIVYAEKFEEFLIELWEIYLRLAKKYLPDDSIIMAVGRREAINIPEFKNSDDLGYQIKIEAQSEDLETKMGKQLVMNHALQYVGNKLEKEDIGKILRNMPFANVDESFNDLTLDYDSAKNMILALDRGQMPVINRYDNIPYMIKRLTSRKRLGDFRFLQPEVQQNYELVISQYEALQAEITAEIERAKAGFIPTGGYLVKCDFYISDPMNPQRTRRAAIPYQSLEWLFKKLEQQGSSLSTLEGIPQGAIAEMAKMVPSGNPQPMNPTDKEFMGGLMLGQASPMQGVTPDGSGNTRFTGF